jgi:hypothetical protein
MLRGTVPVALTAVFVLSGCSSKGATHAVATSGPSGAVSIVVRGDSELVNSVPSCLWPMTVSGKASSAQVGLIRCYIRALVRRSLHDLVPLTATVSGTPVTLHQKELEHAADASSGKARAHFTGDGTDPFDASVEITFADGVRTTVGMDATNVKEPAERTLTARSVATGTGDVC